MALTSPYSPPADRCPVCGALGACPDGAAVPLTEPLLDWPPPNPATQGGPLAAYSVVVNGYTTVMRLNAADAAAYGSAATPL
jgi:hypothetical protein